MRRMAAFALASIVLVGGSFLAAACDDDDDTIGENIDQGIATSEDIGGDIGDEIGDIGDEDETGTPTSLSTPDDTGLDDPGDGASVP